MSDAVVDIKTWRDKQGPGRDDGGERYEADRAFDAATYSADRAYKASKYTADCARESGRYAADRRARSDAMRSLALVFGSMTLFAATLGAVCLTAFFKRHEKNEVPVAHPPPDPASHNHVGELAREMSRSRPGVRQVELVSIAPLFDGRAYIEPGTRLALVEERGGDVVVSDRNTVLHVHRTDIAIWCEQAEWPHPSDAVVLTRLDLRREGCGATVTLRMKPNSVAVCLGASGCSSSSYNFGGCIDETCTQILGWYRRSDGPHFVRVSFEDVVIQHRVGQAIILD